MEDGSGNDGPLLRVENVSVRLGRPPVQAVKEVSFEVRRGEILGLAGESGSGKSVTSMALTRLLPATAAPRCSGTVHLDGSALNLLEAGESRLRRIRGRRIGYIFQEPSASFNPVYTIGQHLDEILRIHGVKREDRAGRVEAALEEVGIPPDRRHLDAWPGDFSGGMLQRVAIACALLGSPELLIADEPTTALDTSTQKRVVDLLGALNRSRNMAILFITHDLGLLKEIASRVLVMRTGTIVEAGPVEGVLMNPRHPYTQDLVRALPRLRL
jgi:ABC-type dipeptide/oligopeptide/nickel transport system ATPase component